MTTQQYLGIRFPERAEFIADEYSSYRVFLDHWGGLANILREHYETLVNRNDTRVLVIYGPQGAGKTMLAQKLAGDLKRARFAEKEQGRVVPDRENFWHRISGTERLDPSLISRALMKAEVHLIENENKWVSKTASWVQANEGRAPIVIADNAERNYFYQGLVTLDDADFLKLSGEPVLHKVAAQRFVEHCRGGLRGALVILLTNDMPFRDEFFLQLDAQHEGLAELADLPLPSASAKETVIRVNTNRLNAISYWYCLDRAGPEDKVRVFNALQGKQTFPDSFRAIDKAIRNSGSRSGRPANKNVISLVVLTPDLSSVREHDPALGALDRGKDEINEPWIVSRMLRNGWAERASLTKQDAAFLESEWKMRLVFLGDEFVRVLLSGRSPDLVRRLLSHLSRVFGTGTHNKTRQAWVADIRQVAASWPAGHDTESFWGAGQVRSETYEDRLKEIYPEYDTNAEGFLGYRPDLVVEPFDACSVTSSASDHIDDIMRAIRRNCHVLEFTSLKTYSSDRVLRYLSTKLDNYVEITREQ